MPYMSLSNQRPSHDNRSGLPGLSEPLAAIAFWSAITLPVLYLPLLMAGLSTTQDLLLFLGLLALHLAALLAGRSYRSR